MTCPNCKNEDKVQRGYKNGYDVSWCVHCGQIRWCSDGLIPASAQGRDDHAEWCAEHLGLVAFGCAGEADKQKLWLDPTQTACKSWCGHHRYCSTGPNLAYVEPGAIEYDSWRVQGCELATDATKQIREEPQDEHSGILALMGQCKCARCKPVHLAAPQNDQDFRRRPASSEAAPLVERLRFMAENDQHLSVIGRETLISAATLLEQQC